MENIKINLTAYYNATIRLFIVFLFSIIIFTAFRTAHLFSYGNLSELKDFKTDIIYTFWTGFKFDATVLAHGYFVIIILNLLILFSSPNATNSNKIIMRLSYFYLVCLYTCYIAFLVIDYFYYMFFQAHINKLVFGILNEPTAILTSVRTDYPITTIVVLYLLIIFLLAYIIGKIWFKNYAGENKNSSYKISILVILIIFYFFALRGTISEHPISKNIDSYVSANTFLNDLTLNGIFAFKETLAERFYGRNTLNLPSILKQSSFLSFYNPGELNANISTIKKIQFVQTPDSPFLKENPPNVVFVLMESMGSYYLDLHSRRLNLMGRLETQLKDCLVFRNFLPLGSSTAQVLIGLATNNPYVSFIQAQQSLSDSKLSSSVALPFLNAGYYTAFITGEYLEWINIGKFMSKQHFQTVVGRKEILSEIKEAKATTAGVYDEFIYTYALNMLKNSKGQPQFIFIMTSSNHTPFNLPESYKPFPVEIGAELAKKIKTNKELAIRNFSAYQYANDSLGRFLEELRSSSLGENTIVVATGDHNNLQLFQFSYTQLLQKLSVPLIMYIPDKYKPAGPIDTTRFGSHKDIFPTIFNLALSGADYLKTGNNLFDDALSTDDYFSVFDNKIAMSTEGVVITEGNPLFYRWQKQNPELIEPTTLLKSPELETLFNKSVAYTMQMNAFFQPGTN